MESRPLTRLSLLVGPSRLDVSRLRSSGDHPSFADPVLGITRLCSSGNDLTFVGPWRPHITRLWSSDDTTCWSLVQLIGCWVLPGFGPLVITLLCRSLTHWFDSPSSCSYRTLPGFGPLAIALSSRSLTHWFDSLIVGRSHLLATSSFSWLTPRFLLKYPSAIQHPGRVLPSLSVLLGAPSTGTYRSPLGSSPRAL